MFYFFINASICHFYFESHIVWNIDDNMFQNLLHNLKFQIEISTTYSSLLSDSLKTYSSPLYFAGHLVCVISARGLRESYRAGDMIKSHVM